MRCCLYLEVECLHRKYGPTLSRRCTVRKVIDGCPVDSAMNTPDFVYHTCNFCFKRLGDCHAYSTQHEKVFTSWFHSGGLSQSHYQGRQQSQTNKVVILRRPSTLARSGGCWLIDGIPSFLSPMMQSYPCFRRSSAIGKTSFRGQVSSRPLQ